MCHPAYVRAQKQNQSDHNYDSKLQLPPCASLNEQVGKDVVCYAYGVSFGKKALSVEISQQKTVKKEVTVFTKLE